MDRLGQSLLFCLTVWWLGIRSAQGGIPTVEWRYEPKNEFKLHDMGFAKHPEGIHSRVGEKVFLSCSFRAHSVHAPARIAWWKDGHRLLVVNLYELIVPMATNDWLTTSTLIIDPWTNSDKGYYRCMAMVGDAEMFSEPGFISLNGETDSGADR